MPRQFFVKTTRTFLPTTLIAATIFLALAVTVTAQDENQHPNVIFILSDDHRYDFMSFMEKAPDFLETPNLDRLAAGGIHLENAFVSTSLCSPSRASILTGQFMHRHKVVDNQRAVPAGTKFFPQYLQQAGYDTAYVGKWHMGHDNDKARPGFNHWVSFRGQGTYYDPTLNINGKQKTFEGYTTDILADQAIAWLGEGRDAQKPFFMYLGFKAVHYPFQPAKRYAGKYREKKIDYPETMANTERNYQTQPHWVRERRYSIHGIDHMETGAFDKDPVPDFDALFHSYCEAVHGLDENIGKVVDHLESSGLDKNTIVVYMGDNGFHLGEHGFYDKRDAFETSIRVPLLVYAPSMFKGGQKIQKMVQNIDIAPTILELCNVKAPAEHHIDGKSMAPLLRASDADRKEAAWREFILYEYHWEWNFPATPTTLAIRTDRYKYVYYHGAWDHNGFYDLQSDPIERHNLINVPAYQEHIGVLKKRLFEELDKSGGLNIPIRPPAGERLDQRKLRR
ncbi:MAG: N-acetylglucosamine-6-sulfatase [Pirellulaceae bacterium]|jgi:N-acetylglucosamine-6-sulfatase